MRPGGGSLTSHEPQKLGWFFFSDITTGVYLVWHNWRGYSGLATRRTVDYHGYGVWIMIPQDSCI
jgi:hypothetical protein